MLLNWYFLSKKIFFFNNNNGLGDYFPIYYISLPKTSFFIKKIVVLWYALNKHQYFEDNVVA